MAYQTASDHVVHGLQDENQIRAQPFLNPSSNQANVKTIKDTP
jgi:hypothetical protein